MNPSHERGERNPSYDELSFHHVHWPSLRVLAHLHLAPGRVTVWVWFEYRYSTGYWLEPRRFLFYDNTGKYRVSWQRQSRVLSVAPARPPPGRFSRRFVLCFHFFRKTKKRLYIGKKYDGLGVQSYCMIVVYRYSCTRTNTFTLPINRRKKTKTFDGRRS